MERPTNTTLISRVQSALDRRAARLAHRLRWTALSPLLALASAPDAEMEQNILDQCEAALATVLICVPARPLPLVFLLNRTGLPKGPDSLMHGGFRHRITSDDLIATCTVHPEHASGLSASALPPPDDAVVLWIDDLSVPTPFVDPYASRLKSILFRRAPSLLDIVRQRRTGRANRAMRAALPAPATDAPFVSRSDASPAGRPSVLFCLYWLDFGGAEAFALEMMRAAHDRGYRVVVACDETGRHRVLQRASRWADTTYLIGSFGYATGRMEALYRIVLAERPDILHIHHSWSAYRLLPILRTLGLVERVVDTTHIVEHRFGGFPRESALYAGYIDLHHVISRDLRDFFVRDCRLPEADVGLGVLHDLAKHVCPAPGKWAARTPLRVLFVGRFVQQKRPYLFLEVARALLHGDGRNRFRFQAVGEGELRPLCERIATDSHLADTLEFLPGASPVPELLAHAHAVVISSDNEGLTLLAFEAIRADCLVISADVGGQRELVDDALLLDRHAPGFKRGAVRVLRSLADGSLDPAPLLASQNAKLRAAEAEPSGVEICLRAYETAAAPAGNVSAA